jgi:hypothetical protein
MTKAVCGGVVMMVTMTVGASQAAAQEQFGEFTFIPNKDPMSDADRSSIMVDGADNPRKTGLGWGCKDEGLRVMLLWGRYLMGDDDRISVEYRFAAQPVVNDSWNLSTTHRSGFLPKKDTQKFTTQALTAGTVTLRVTDRDGDRMTETFKLDGLAEALRQLPCAAR